VNRRIFSGLVALAGVAGLGFALSPPARAQEFGSPELIAAAKKEGKLVFYTANFAEIEQQVIKEFNKRFPEIKVEMVRAPGGQLITRVRTEAATLQIYSHWKHILLLGAVRPSAQEPCVIDVPRTKFGTVVQLNAGEAKCQHRNRTA